MPRSKIKVVVPARNGRPMAKRATKLGQAITDLRGERTLAEAAAKVKTTLGTWRKWETGELQPTNAQLAVIAKAFGAKPRDLAAAAMAGWSGLD